MNERIRNLLAQCAYPSFKYELLDEDGRLFLRVNGFAPDNVSGDPITWIGRKWRLSEHMTDGEVVQTAWLATLTAIEHEARENFRFQGVTVFDPHYDIHKLVALRRQSDSIKERA